MRSSRSDETNPQRPDGEAGEDIEILEVVGVDEDGAPIAGADSEDVEVEFDFPAAPDASEVPEALPEEPSEEFKLKERLIRLQADFENFRKRVDRERVDHYQYAVSGLIRRILPALDNFDRAMASARPGSGEDTMLAGFSLIQRQLLAELEAEGLRPMDAVGETFDPIRHEAVATDHESEMPAHTVTEVFQKGYFLHERVLRPALVRVRVDESDGHQAADDGKESSDG